MKFYFYRGKENNFGDELNLYLLPRLLPDFFDDADDPLFLGVGSILFDTHPPDVRKIVFGAGYGGYTAKPVLDDKWTIYSVRGPRTARALGLEPQKVAADLAVLMTLYRSPSPQKRYKFSFVPHFESLTRSNWEEVAAKAGLHFIDPRNPVEQVLAELEASEVVIAEAMHGAIVSDALRVPWIALAPNDNTHHFKWFDWAEALDIKLRPQPMAPASVYELGMTARVFGRSLRRFVSPIAEPLKRLSVPQLQDRAVNSLVKASKTEPNLSPQGPFDAAVSRLQDDLLKLRRDFAA
jgi:succinoglycan biosynthesis protein ExoV